MTQEINTNFETDPYDDELTLGGITPVPVRIVASETRRLAADFSDGSQVQVPLAGTGQGFVQLLQRRPNRDQAYIVNTGFLTGSYVPVFRGTYNQTVAPGASVSLANFSGGSALPPGPYQVTAQTYFGPATAPVDGVDNDNFFFAVDGVSIGGQLLAPAVENLVGTYNFPLVNTTTGAIAIKSKGAGTALVVYRTALFVTSLDVPTGSVLIASSLGKLQNGAGYVLGPGQTQKIEGQEAWYALALSTPVTVNVLDESWEDTRG